MPAVTADLRPSSHQVKIGPREHGFVGGEVDRLGGWVNGLARREKGSLRMPGGRVTRGCEIDQDSYDGLVQGCEGKARQGERGLRLLCSALLCPALLAARAHLRCKFVHSAGGGQPLS